MRIEWPPKDCIKYEIFDESNKDRQNEDYVVIKAENGSERPNKTTRRVAGRGE